jgi:serine/threonine protein kinase
MEDLRINPDVEIQQATLYIRGNYIDKYEIMSKLGQGNNGIVFLAKHKLLHTFSALKVWLKLNPVAAFCCCS